MMTVNNCTISGNGQNGGILNYATLTVSNSTISGNTEGGVYNFFGTLTISNSTISGNTASRSQRAGGINNQADFDSDATVQLLNTTVSDNTSTDRTGSQLVCRRYGTGTGNATIQLRNTIIYGDGRRPNFFAYSGGRFVSQGHNLSSDDGSGFLTGPGDLPNTDPRLGPLQDNGGPTKTRALLPGSPAIDAGDNNDAPEFDQRGPGFARIVGGTIDIGAFQAQPGAATHFQVRAPAHVSSGMAFDVTVTAVDTYGHTAAGYVGTVTLSSSDTDPGIVLPADYTFTADDNGVHPFASGFTLVTVGDQTLTATAMGDSTITGSAIVTVDPAPAAPPGGGTRKLERPMSGSGSFNESSAFSGLPLAEQWHELQSGVPVLDMPIGRTAEFLEFNPGVEDIFDVQLLLAVRFPAVIGFERGAVHHMFVVPQGDGG